MSTTSTAHRSRRPAGVPTGGQFAPEVHAEPEVALPGATGTGSDTVSFADVTGEDRIRAMQAEIESAVERISDPEEWQRFLETMSRFHTYSFGNAMLILAQRPDATRVAGFKAWKSDFGRSVKKGEKGIWILAPMVREVDRENPTTGEVEKQKRVVGFRGVTVFDVSQTEGEPLPEGPAHRYVNQLGEGEAPAGMRESLTSWIEAQGYTVDDADDIGGANGSTSPLTKQVRILSSMTERQKAKTLAHEAAHIALGHMERTGEYHLGGGRSVMEIEAESVSYVVGRTMGLDDAGDYAFGYVAHWAKGSPEQVRATADTVCKTAARLIGELPSAAT